MIKYEYASNGKLIRHIFFAGELSFAEFSKEINSCDELCIFYAGRLDEKIEEEYGEILVYMTHGSNWHVKDYSLSIDLTKDSAEIFKDFHKNRRYEIRRAKERDGVKVVFDESPDIEKLEQTELFYNQFAASKNLRAFDYERYASAAGNDIFLLADAYADDGELLVINGYLLDCEKKISTLSFSASHFRECGEKAALIGRANGYLHFAAMCYLKKKGFAGYDMGGVYIGEDKELSNISSFKRSLGGELKEYAPKIIFQQKAYQTIEDNLSKLKSIVQERNIIIWGMATWGKYIVKRLKELYGIAPACMIDTALSAVCPQISSPDVLKQYSSSKHYLIVTTDIGPYKRICGNESVKPFIEEHSVLCIKEEKL